MLSFHVLCALCKNTYVERFAARWLPLCVAPDAGLPEDASRAMAPTGVFSDGGVAADGGAGISNSGCPGPLSASENAL